MTSLPSLSRHPPIRFVGHVVLSPHEAQALLQLLPEGSPLAVELRTTLAWSVAEAERLNRVDRGEKS